MKSVLYTEELEPIAIIDLPADLHHFKWPYGHTWRVVVPEKLSWRDFDTKEEICTKPIRTVDIYIEVLRRGENRYPMFIVKEKHIADAMLLEAEMLPGQEKEMTKAFEKGIRSAVSRGWE